MTYREIDPFEHSFTHVPCTASDVLIAIVFATSVDCRSRCWTDALASVLTVDRTPGCAGEPQLALSMNSVAPGGTGDGERRRPVIGSRPEPGVFVSDLRDTPRRPIASRSGRADDDVDRTLALPGARTS